MKRPSTNGLLINIKYLGWSPADALRLTRHMGPGGCVLGLPSLFGLLAVALPLPPQGGLESVGDKGEAGKECSATIPRPFWE